MTHFETLHDLLVDQLEDIYDAEHQLIEALPRMASAATSNELRTAFENHLEETREHAARLVQVFQKLNMPAERKPCKAMAGLIREAEEVINASGDANVIDAALIAAAQRIEHYEIAAYGCVKAFARRCDHRDVVGLLDESMNEEGSADKLLTKIAEGSLLQTSINKQAAKHST